MKRSVIQGNGYSMFPGFREQRSTRATFAVVYMAVIGIIGHLTHFEGELS